MTKVVAVVQARMGSTRLPGKMLAEIGGHALVDYVLTRLTSELGPDRLFSDVVLATSRNEENEPLADRVLREWPNVRVIRGEEDDVLSRFLEAVRLTEAEVIVRVTGDCPLINLEAVRQMLDAQTATQADVVNYRPGYEYIDKGIEVVSAQALLKLASDQALSAHDREHVTSALYRNHVGFNAHYIDSEPWVRRADLRLTIDTDDDLRFFRALSSHMSGSLMNAALSDVVAILDAQPELARINSGSGRKSSMHESARVGFRCDGGAGLGMGHVVGSLRLARLLADQLGWGMEFVCRDEENVCSAIHAKGFAVELLPADTSPEDDVTRLLNKASESDWSAVVINFGKDDLYRYRNQFTRFRQAGVKLVFMDNPVAPYCYEAELLINALPHPDYPGYEPDNHPACLDGLAYFLPADHLESVPGRPCPQLTLDGRVFVAMGGGDVDDLTIRVLEGLASAGFRGEVDVVVGASSPLGGKLASTLAELGLDGSVTVNAEDMNARMQRADLGFTGLGLVTYEMAYAGLPALIIANSDFNAGVAKTYCKHYRTARFVGAWPRVTVDEIADAVTDVVGGNVPWATHYASDRDPGRVIASGRDAIVAAFRTLVREPLPTKDPH